MSAAARVTGGLSARSVVKYHALLHKIFSRALIDRVVPTNPCTHTELPKVVTAPKRIITADQFDAILTKVPARYRTMVLLAIETGLRWGGRSRYARATSTSPHGSSPCDARSWRSRGRTPPRVRRPQSRQRRSIIKSPSTTRAPRTPRGCLLAAPTSSSSKNVSATAASPPLSNTPANSPTPANAHSPPFAASDTANRHPASSDGLPIPIGNSRRLAATAHGVATRGSNSLPDLPALVCLALVKYCVGLVR